MKTRRQSFKDFLQLRTNLQTRSRAQKQCTNTFFVMLGYYSPTLLNEIFLYHCVVRCQKLNNKTILCVVLLIRQVSESIGHIFVALLCLEKNECPPKWRTLFVSVMGQSELTTVELEIKALYFTKPRGVKSVEGLAPEQVTC